MSMLLRSFGSPLEVRDDGRTLEGVAVPYNVETRVGRYVESFAAGAFTDAPIHTLTAAHPRDGGELPIGVSVELRNEADGLHGAWHISDTTLGNEVLALVRDGVPLGLSIGFIPGRERWNSDRTKVERISATLDHVAVVRSPAYPDARIAALRAAGDHSSPLLFVARLRR